MPVELRDRAGLVPGTPLILADTDTGVVIMTREQARQRIKEQLQGQDLVRELMDERREAAAREDAE